MQHQLHLPLFKKDTFVKFGPTSKSGTYKRYRQRNPETCKQRIKSWQLRPENIAKHREKRRQEVKRLRLEMLNAYGSYCHYCGEVEQVFLTLEHTNGDGYIDRKLRGNGESMYRSLKKDNWPKNGYTILCWNCNQARRYGNQCPHEVKKNGNHIN